jgi:GH15 family glucan-1,4-alpha-glucosidase
MDWLTTAPRARGRGEGRSRSCTASTAARAPEESLDHLEGYRGSSPCGSGTAPREQLQLDIYGELIDSVYLYNKYGAPISTTPGSDCRGSSSGLRQLGPADEGIWETRGGSRTSPTRG